MKTNEKFLSFYYRNMKEIPDIHLDLKKNSSSDRGYAETFHRKRRLRCTAV